jgi:hypothetical protein
MSRRVYDKYDQHSAHAALILKRLKPDNIGKLLNFLESKISYYEGIEIEEWYNERFYIIVIDHRFPTFPENAAVGFTVNIDNDTLILNSRKGNCFVRSPKWKRLLRIAYPFSYQENDFHIYKSIKIPS